MPVAGVIPFTARFLSSRHKSPRQAQEVLHLLALLISIMFVQDVSTPYTGLEGRLQAMGHLVSKLRRAHSRSSHFGKLARTSDSPVICTVEEYFVSL